MQSTFDFPWVRLINPQPEEVAEGRLVLAHEPEALHLNHNGDINAAVLFSLAEMAGMGVVVTTLGEQASQAYVVIKRGVIDFRGRARGRIRAAAHLSAEQLERVRAAAGKGVGIEEVVGVEIRDATDRVVATSTVTAVIRPRRQP